MDNQILQFTRGRMKCHLSSWTTISILKNRNRMSRNGLRFRLAFNGHCNWLSWNYERFTLLFKKINESSDLIVNRLASDFLFQTQPLHGHWNDFRFNWISLLIEA